MVFKEIEHVIFDIVCALPLIGDAACRTTLADDVAYAVVHPHFIVEIVKTTFDIVAVLTGVIDFSDKNDVGKSVF